MKVVHLLRKPMGRSVAETAVKWGTGSLNIDGTRLGGESTLRTQNAQEAFYDNGTQQMWQGGVTGSVKGRWPPNVVLMHHCECSIKGVHYEDFLINVYALSDNFQGYQWKSGEAKIQDIDSMSNGQWVEEWDCVSGCPVFEFDNGVGVLSSGTGAVKKSSAKGSHGNTSAAYGKENRPAGTAVISHGDSGGPSRYFKQVNSEERLVEYLVTMASTPNQQAVVLSSGVDTSSLEEKSLCGVVLKGRLTQELLLELDRLLKPGSHVILMPSDESPLGHREASMAEDYGFEVRDSILVVTEARYAHYVSKASRKEREAGCGHLSGKKADETVKREPGSPGSLSPSAGAGRGAGADRYRCRLCDVSLCGGRIVSDCSESEDGNHVPVKYGSGPKVKNHHPTVKAVDLMRKLLHDVPDGGVVLDPFMGSGTTGIACVMEQKSFVGMEREEPFFDIANARIRHWDRAHVGWQPTEIESDKDPVSSSTEDEPIDAFDFLDG